jgi:adenylate cyclase
MHLMGKHPSNFNPNYCNICDEFARQNIGGVEIELTMLFADVRGSTTLAEQMETGEFSQLISRFYAVATNVLIRHDAFIDKLVGDQATGFLPGMAVPITPARLFGAGVAPATGTRSFWPVGASGWGASGYRLCWGSRI